MGLSIRYGKDYKMEQLIIGGMIGVLVAYLYLKKELDKMIDRVFNERNKDAN